MKNGALILEIKGNSLDDGPGIRTVVFLKGCPLDCVWCHNPESKSKRKEISFDKTSCIGCDTCLKTCKLNALNRAEPFFINRELCDLCFDCVEKCPSEALSHVGKEVRIPDILNLLKKDIPFFQTSGGGLTVSGGEPLLFMDFTSSLLQAAKELGIQTLIETCGLFSYDSFMETIAPYCDLLYFDIKLIDNENHKKYCGVPNKIILGNLTRFSALSDTCTFTLLPRIPLVPGITDTRENLEGIALFLKRNNLSKVQLLGYNPLWAEKCEKIGRTNQLPNQPGSGKWTSKEQMDSCRSIFANHGIEVV